MAEAKPRRPKSRHGDGGYYRRKDGVYCAQLWIDGVRYTRYAGTEAAIKRTLRELRQLREQGRTPVPERLTVADYLAQWLEGAKPGLTQRAYERYEEIVRLHLVPQIGRKRLALLAPLHVQTMEAALRETLSATTVLHVHRCLHTALEQALRWGLVQRNVAALVTPPRREAREATVLTLAQIERYFAAAAGDRLEALHILAITTGMREGELLGLLWANVDLDRGELYIRTQLSTPRGGAVLKTPKTARSRRPVPLVRRAVEALRRHRVRQAEERLAAGAGWQDKGLVFANRTGGFILPQNYIRREFRPLLTRAGLPLMRPHDLRHGAATLLLEQGVHPRLVADLLGHTRIGITLDTYTSSTPTTASQTRAALERIFGSAEADGSSDGSSSTESGERR